MPAWDEIVVVGAAAAVDVVLVAAAAPSVVGAKEVEQSKFDYSSGEWSTRCWEWVLLASVAGTDS
jgi:hypothetical protein